MRNALGMGTTVTLATVLFLSACAGPGITVSQGGEIYWSNLQTERAKMAKQREKRAKDKTKRLEKILKAIDQQEKASITIIEQRAKQQALREEIARRVREGWVRDHTHR